ncbi:MAG: phosphodiester glycosidase family protein [Deltaproteobacteria bacterium]|nr:phosphodiester glycosidase family protein [Deltaproteobacteria bacterium]
MRITGSLSCDFAEINPLRNVAWWGVFSIDKNAVAHIDALKDFQMSSGLQIAIQVGPRLVDNGHVVSGLKTNISQKTFVAQTADSEIILGVTQKGLLDSIDLAKILANELKAKEALCFDGGSSTQLYSKINGVVKEVFGLSPVVSGVVVVPR